MRPFPYRIPLSTAALFLVWTCALASAEGQRSPHVRKLLVDPAAAPRPALAHQLLPRLADARHGTAAPLYLQAFLSLRERTVDWKKLNGWLKMPPEDLPQDQVERALSQLETTFSCVDRAARRAHYGEGLLLGTHEEGLRTMNFDMAAFRTVTRLLILRIRLQTLQGDYDGAIESLQTGYAMARHSAERPTVLSCLVGVAITQIMNQCAGELIEAPDAPNLYWALSTLPEVPIDLAPALDYESAALAGAFPEFAEAVQSGATPDEWRALYHRVVFPSPDPGHGEEEDGTPLFGSDETAATLIEKCKDTARANLAASGEAVSELDRMSPAEIATRGLFDAYRAQHDELARLHRLPYWQAEPHLGAARDRIESLGRIGLMPNGGRGLPGDLTVVIRASARLRRYHAGLRCVEAIRLYAAVHDGRLPNRLEDVSEVPIPLNPHTGRPFPYRVEAGQAILDLDGDVDPDDFVNPIFNRRWLIRLRD